MHQTLFVELHCYLPFSLYHTFFLFSDYNGVYYSVNFKMDKVHVDNEGHIVFCSQPKVFSIECSYNTDFNDMFGDATERIFTFYSWGMIEKWIVPKANLTTKLIYMRLSEENNYLLE